MTHPAIQVDDLWKEYAAGAALAPHSTFYDLLSQAVTQPLAQLRKLCARKPPAEQFWALSALEFQVQPGEVVGIIGRNGAGKSTLLKVLSRITAPTRGRVTVRGRVASLLEVGTGFHPELTGRENVYLNATILGMTRREIDRKFDAIVAFAGIGKFLDTPVKRYSSGMYVRLAFAVAAHVDADILLVDEVLAVGDAEFQKRCLGLMGEVARTGRAVLFVSHNLTALRNLCTTGLLLDRGRVQARGTIADVLNQYASNGVARSTMAVDLAEPGAHTAASIRRVAVVPGGEDANAHLSVKTPFTIVTTIEVRQPDVEIGVFLHCHDSDGNQLFSTGSFFEPELNGTRLEAGRHEFACAIPGDLLNDGEYTLDVILIKDRTEIVVSESAILSFRVHDAPTGIEGWNWPVVGLIRPQLGWSRAQVAALNC
jgi:lipopolysaccharide transport system ATP-binding protein